MKLLHLSTLLAVLGSVTNARRRPAPRYAPSLGRAVLHHEETLVSRQQPAAPATDEVWDRCVCRCFTMMKQMQADDKGAGQLMSPPVDHVESPYTSDGEAGSSD
jgi:hypothetical protein